MKRELRQYLKYDGQALAEIDLSNSQLFFILPLLDWRNWVARKERRGKISISSSLWIGLQSVCTNNNTIMFLKNLETLYGKGLQSLPFAHDACKGIVYESIIAALDDLGYFGRNTSVEMKRDLVKRNLLQLLFACPKKHRKMYKCRSGQIWVTFKKLYPEVGELIEMIKRTDYHYVSMLLQRIESFCMIRGVCKAIYKKYPDVPVFTLHDCIVTTKDNVSIVRDLLLSTIIEVTGFKPAVKVKHWDKQGEIRKHKRTFKEMIYSWLRKRAA